MRAGLAFLSQHVARRAGTERRALFLRALNVARIYAVEWRHLANPLVMVKIAGASLNCAPMLIAGKMSVAVCFYRRFDSRCSTLSVPLDAALAGCLGYRGLVGQVRG